MDIKRCGAFIAQLRKDEGLTQKDLASHLGVTDKAVSRWETGNGLPDAELLLALSEHFCVTINELLRGERMDVSETIVQTAEENVVDVLKMCDDEKKKIGRLRVTVVVAVLCAVAVLVTVFGGAIAAEFRGDGRSLSAMYYTNVAQKTAELIEKGDYERASDNIGFLNRDRETAQAKWIADMTALFSTKFKIESFEVFAMTEDDEFISGKARLEIVDFQTSQLSAFEVTVNEQDGIAFAGIRSLDRTASRSEETERLLMKALSTYNPG